MWPLESRGGRQVAVGYLIVLTDITCKFFCSVLLWVASRPFYFHHRNFLQPVVLVGEHVMLLISPHKIAVNPYTSPIFNVGFFSQICRACPFVCVALSCIYLIFWSLWSSKIVGKKKIVHWKFVSCTCNYVSHIFKSYLCCFHVSSGCLFVLTQVHSHVTSLLWIDTQFVNFDNISFLGNILPLNNSVFEFYITLSTDKLSKGLQNSK